MIKSALTGELLKEPIYNSITEKSITSLSKIYNGATQVFYDEKIGHLQTNEIENITEYYDEQYEFFNDSEEDDILYRVKEGKKIFRQQHQIDILLQKIQINEGIEILDYGCGKGTVLKRLHLQRPDIIPYLFDVSRMYVPLWQKFLRPHQYASYNARPEWSNKFDLITSFFAFEHTPDPVKELRTIRGLLKSDGLVYMIVPNVFKNIGDFIVADHIHHYSETSLRFLFSMCGFEIVEVDDFSHFAAFIVTGKKSSSEQLDFEIRDKQLIEIRKKANKLADFWISVQDRINHFERSNSNLKSAIYGAGVYGTFIAINIKEFSNVECFVDQNPLLHGKTIMNKKIVLPNELPEDVRVIYSGLNPEIAKQALTSILEWENRDFNYFYL